VNPSLQAVNRPPDDFELSMIVCGDCCLSLRFHLTDSRFNRALVDAHDVVVLVLNAERLRKRHDQVLFI
jgi:hypothetical protein